MWWFNTFASPFSPFLPDYVHVLHNHNKFQGYLVLDERVASRVLKQGWSTRQTARYYGYNQITTNRTPIGCTFMVSCWMCARDGHTPRWPNRSITLTVCVFCALPKNEIMGSAMRRRKPESPGSTIIITRVVLSNQDDSELRLWVTGALRLSICYYIKL